MRTQLAPADKESTRNLFDITSQKSVYPLDLYPRIDRLPFKITVKMMVAVTKEAVRASSYDRAAESICGHYGAEISNDTVRKVTDFVGGIVFQDDTNRAKQAMESHAAQIDKRKKHKRTDDVLYIEMDGVMVNTRAVVNGSSWTECQPVYRGYLNCYAALSASGKKHIFSLPITVFL